MFKSNQKLYTVIIVLLLVIISVISILLISSRDTFDKEIIFSLKGNKDIVIYLGEKYEELGYIAHKGNIDLFNKVEVNGYVNTMVSGDYKMTYSLVDSNGNKKTLVRNVRVKYADGITLKGENDIYLLLNGTYQELGFVAYKDNIDISSQVMIDNEVDTSRKGDYLVTYSYDNYKVVRKVHVSDFSEYFIVSYDEKTTNKSIDLNIRVDNKKISKYHLPNDEERNKDSIYTVNDNGEYNFFVYDLYGNSSKYSINISNIDKVALQLSCKATITGNSTNVVVTTNKKIVKYFYNNKESSLDKYTLSGRNKDVNVKVIDEYNNSKEVKCSVEYRSSTLEIHFIASGHYDDAILIRTDDKTIFIDGGRPNCATKVLAYLNELGITKIDALIGSHLQNNHIATQAAILDRFSVDKVYYPDNIFNCVGRSCIQEDQQDIVSALHRHNKTPLIINAPKLVEIGEMKLYFIGPYSIVNNPSNNNNNSFIFILKFRDNAFMFTGDSDSPLDNVDTLRSKASSLGIGIDVDMLKYPHHGNKTLKNVFLQAITPKYVIVPNYNAPSYPSQNNVDCIKNVGGSIYRQSDSPNIVLVSDGKNISVKLQAKASNFKRNW